MSTEKPITIKLEFEKETKNTVRDREVNEDGLALVGAILIGAIYIQKWVLKNKPKTITITINQ